MNTQVWQQPEGEAVVAKVKIRIRSVEAALNDSVPEVRREAAKVGAG